MDSDWILLKHETRRFYGEATWIPLRASCSSRKMGSAEIGYITEYFGCGSVAFPPEYHKLAEELTWNDIGISLDAKPYAYKDGYYSTIEQFQYEDYKPIGVHLVFDYPQPVIGGRKWILNSDLVVALHLVKEGNNWVRPEENFEVVVREILGDDGNHKLIEIKREFLIDYLAARNLSLRLSTYRQRVENVERIEGSNYEGLYSYKEQRDGGEYELLIRNISDVYGGGWASYRVWRTDIDNEEDAPVMGAENDENTDLEMSQGYYEGYEGVRIEGEFWRDEWIEHKGLSLRIRGDLDPVQNSFIVDTDGSRMLSEELNNENIGRWLWFRPSIVTELLTFRGFKFEWYTAQTGEILSTSGYRVHFGINYSDLITVYAYDIARLDSWEQRIWAAHNVLPDGKISKELFDAQVNVMPASTIASEKVLLESMRVLEFSFKEKMNISLFNHDINDKETSYQVLRFNSKDQGSLLRLAKDIIRVFSDRLNVRELRKISKHDNKENLGTNKLLESILADKVGIDKAHEVFRVIAGTYDLRLNDAHPTSSKISEALTLAGIDSQLSYLRQGEQLIKNFTFSVCEIVRLLFHETE